MIYTKEKFKEIWESDNSPNGNAITFKDIADCAKAWGLYSNPIIHNIAEVTKAVTDAAGLDLSID